MIDNNLTSHVLTIGPQYKNPQGGIAQTVYNYRHLIFGDGFTFVANSRKGNKVLNLMTFVASIFWLVFYLLFARSVRLVHIHTASKRSFTRSVLYMKLAKFYGKKVVMHVHGGGFRNYYEQHKRFVETNLLKCDAIVALTDYWKDFFSKEIKHPCVYVVNNVIPEPKGVNRVQDESGIVHGLFLGNINREKGIFDLVQVLGEHVADYRGRFVLHIGGTGMTQELKSQIKDYSIDDMVTLEGWVSGEKKHELLCRSGIFLLPSYIEGLPISILEAMSYGCCVLSTQVGGIPTIVTDGKNGILFDAGNLDALHLSLKRLVDDESLRETMGERSHLLVKAFYPEAVSRSLAEIYDNLLKN